MSGSGVRAPSFLLLMLLLLLSSFLLLHSRELLRDHDRVVSDYAFDHNVISIALDQSKANYGLQKDFGFGSRGGRGFSTQQELAFPVDRRSGVTRVWPSLLQDYMREQFKFRGRTKKGNNKL